MSKVVKIRDMQKLHQDIENDPVIRDPMANLIYLLSLVPTIKMSSIANFFLRLSIWLKLSKVCRPNFIAGDEYQKVLY